MLGNLSGGYTLHVFRIKTFLLLYLKGLHFGDTGSNIFIIIANLTGLI